jgi:ribosomal protein S18 acetylase RimI-like enzyme
MEIRKAINPDSLNISSIGMCVWVDTYATTGVFDKISQYIHTELTEDKIHEIIKNKSVYVCSEEKCLFGYIVLGMEEDNKIEIETLYVLPKFQRKGIGKLLLEHSLSEAKTYWLSAYELNHKAIAFYLKHGFKETGEMYFDLYGDKIRNIVLETTQQ